jgi:hypothetical protein
MELVAECMRGFFGQKSEERDYLEYLDIDGRIILKCILKNRMGRCRLD